MRVTSLLKSKAMRMNEQQIRNQAAKEIKEFILSHGTEVREVCGEETVYIVPLPGHKSASERNVAWADAIHRKFIKAPV